MDRRTASLAVLVVAAMTVVAIPAAGLEPGDITGSQGLPDDVSDGANAQAATNGTDNRVSPGLKLTGIVGVQKAEIEGEVQSRGFQIALNRSDSKAAVIADQVTDLKSELDALRERKDELDQARANGTITEDEYRAQIAEIGARISTVQRLANRTETVSRGIPAEKLEENGVNATEIQELRNNARNLSGQGVAAIAREIAGPGAGKGLGRGPPKNKTNPGQGNGANPGQGNGANPGQGNGVNPGQGNDTGPGDDQPGMGESGPPESNTSDNGTVSGPAEAQAGEASAQKSTR
ncbi:MAG: hypothetical protein ABEH88_09180 [Halobacteriales archaeon]